MKTVLYLASFSLLFSVIACRRNNPMPAPVAPVDQLPAYTETGANTFGCLIDGQVFVPGKPAFSSYTILQCTYQYINDKMYFSLGAGNFKNNNNATYSKGVSMHVSDTLINVRSYAIGDAFNDRIYGLYSNSDSSTEVYYTNYPTSGELIIQHFDSIKQIVSGTFWFNALDTSTGIIKHITDGRFDVRYTK